MFAIISGVLIPDKTTAIQMFAASHITPNNIKIAGETVEKSIDKIIDKSLDILTRYERKKRGMEK